MLSYLSNGANKERKALVLGGKPFTFKGMISTFRIQFDTLEIEYLCKGKWLSYAVINSVLPHCVRYTLVNSTPRFKEGKFDYIDIRW